MDYSGGGGFYYRLSSRRSRSKEVQVSMVHKLKGTIGLVNLPFQVIPWLLSDSNFVRCPSQRLDPSKTVFVGALHGVFGAKCVSGAQYTTFRCLDC